MYKIILYKPDGEFKEYRTEAFSMNYPRYGGQPITTHVRLEFTTSKGETILTTLPYLIVKEEDK